MNAISRILCNVFGLTCLLLSLVVGFESISRKFFSYSLQGVDELSGYALALLSGIGFTVALIGRNHTRIDVLYEWFPVKFRHILDWLSALLFAAFSLLMAAAAYHTWIDSIEYRSTAPTPLATPIMYPQAIWLAALVFFAALSVYQAMRATKLFAVHDWQNLHNEFCPKSAKKELAEEIQDYRNR